MDVADAVAELYRVFRRYRLDADFSGCSDCVNPSDTARLVNTPVRNLNRADLYHYAFKAMTTWGEVCHFKHFLPRLFQLAAEDPRGLLSLEVLFGKLAYGHWESWPKRERCAVNDYLHAFWLSVLAAECADDDELIDTVLCAIGNASSSVELFLAEWIPAEGDEPCRQLGRFVVRNVGEIVSKGQLANGHWHGRTKQQQDVINWLCLPSVFEFLYDRRDRLDPGSSETVCQMLDVILRSQQ